MSPSVLREANGPLHNRALLQGSTSMLWVEHPVGTEPVGQLSDGQLGALFTVEPVSLWGIRPEVADGATSWPVTSQWHLYDILTNPDLLQAHGITSTWAVARLGEALRDIHATRFDEHLGGSIPVIRHRETSPRWWSEGFRERCREYVSELRDSMPGLPFRVDVSRSSRSQLRPLSLTHGRAKLSFVEVGGDNPEGVRLLGWREAAWADPIIDVACVLGDLCEMAAGGVNGALTGPAVFLDSYLSGTTIDTGFRVDLAETAIDMIVAHGAAFLEWGKAADQLPAVTRYCAQAASIAIDNVSRVGSS